eukprot:TRINITY_DN121610_c0_g1_i1.p1 TRINITY_DN121610_c0_g1~~TRINITY_DN121610_c0_g1_i1.p1  ORF type:complete len:544 (+),score=168.72 TRINITY_DN121610_c0_g1_i1:146-1777(+)
MAAMAQDTDDDLARQLLALKAQHDQTSGLMAELEAKMSDRREEKHCGAASSEKQAALEVRAADAKHQPRTPGLNSPLIEAKPSSETLAETTDAGGEEPPSSAPSSPGGKVGLSGLGSEVRDYRLRSGSRSSAENSPARSRSVMGSDSLARSMFSFGGLPQLGGSLSFGNFAAAEEDSTAGGASSLEISPQVSAWPEASESRELSQRSSNGAEEGGGEPSPTQARSGSGSTDAGSTDAGTGSDAYAAQGPPAGQQPNKAPWKALREGLFAEMERRAELAENRVEDLMAELAAEKEASEKRHRHMLLHLTKKNQEAHNAKKDKSKARQDTEDWVRLSEERAVASLRQASQAVARAEAAEAREARLLEREAELMERLAAVEKEKSAMAIAAQEAEHKAILSKAELEKVRGLLKEEHARAKRAEETLSEACETSTHGSSSVYSPERLSKLSKSQLMQMQLQQLRTDMRKSKAREQAKASGVPCDDNSTEATAGASSVDFDLSNIDLVGDVPTSARQLMKSRLRLKMTCVPELQKRKATPRRAVRQKF